MNFSKISAWLARVSPARRLAAVFVIYLAVRWFVLGAMAPVSFIDTASYADQYRHGFAEGFFGRARSWGYPLIFWLTGHHEQAVVIVQRLAATLAWFTLALALGRLFRTPLGRRAAFWGTLVMSLTLFSVMWDAILLSEGLTIDCFIALTAAWIFLLQSEKTGLLPLGALVAAGILFAGMRDSSLPLLLAYAAVVVITLALRHFFSGPPRPPRRVLWGGLALTGLLLACILAQIHEVRRCGRNWQSVAASLSFRAYRQIVWVQGGFIDNPGRENNSVDEEKIQWLAEHYQLPVEDARARMGLTAYDPPPLTPRYREWLATTGQRAWLGYMLHYPAETFKFFNFYRLHNLTAPGLQYAQHDAPKWQAAHLGLPTLIQNSFQAALRGLLGWEWVNTFFTVLALALGIVWIAGWTRPSLRGAARIAGVLSWLLGTSMAALFVGVFGDYAEPWRHSIVGIVALYAAVPVAIAVILEASGMLLKKMEPAPQAEAGRSKRRKKPRR